MIYRILSVTPVALKITILVAGLVVNEAGESLLDQTSDELATVCVNVEENTSYWAAEAGRVCGGGESQDYISR